MARPVPWGWNSGGSWVHTSFNSAKVNILGAKYLYKSFIVCLRRNPSNGINESKEMHLLSLLLSIASCPPEKLFRFPLPQMVCQSAISCVFARSGYYLSFFFFFNNLPICCLFNLCGRIES